ncbi:Mating-type M-specific polypeptide Mc [Trametes pubescens]|uniref:Mating-type M-specific polypeptide Mc n=1 Tax=Trametes pubescens TaxID=154538 RepID=A0A1M2W3D5_TRAPU|nr:Mating-type M-specific polypeptide Mc [Trametes pubescens]
MSTPTTEPHIPRPSNAFFLYRQHVNARLKAANPKFHQANASKTIAVQWHQESAEVQAEYKRLADEVKEEHKRKYPDYQFKPVQKKKKPIASRPPTKERIYSRSAAPPQTRTPTLSPPHRAHDPPLSPQMWPPKRSSRLPDVMTASYHPLSSASSSSSGKCSSGHRTPSPAFGSSPEPGEAPYTLSELEERFPGWMTPPPPHEYRLDEGTLSGEQFFPDGASMGLFLPPNPLPFDLTMPALAMEDLPMYSADERDDEKPASPPRCPGDCGCHKRPLEDLLPYRYPGVPLAILPAYAPDLVAFASAEGEAWFNFSDAY